MFSGTGTVPDDYDAAIEGTAYLTYSLVFERDLMMWMIVLKCGQVETCGKLHIFTTNEAN